MIKARHIGNKPRKFINLIVAFFYHTLNPFHPSNTHLILYLYKYIICSNTPTNSPWSPSFFLIAKIKQSRSPKVKENTAQLRNDPLS